MSDTSVKGLAIGQRSIVHPEAEHRAWFEALLERELIPDSIVRMGIRHFLKQRLREESRGGEAAIAARKLALVASLKSSAIALQADAANRQHYEVPPEFFEKALGRRMKYSSTNWPEGVRTLDDAEESMLALTCERARLKNGQRVLELGCGWGSLSLYIAEHFPESAIVGVSNSRTQRGYIESRAAELGLQNLRIVTADMNEFTCADRFDRIVSVEMFEHMRNYEALLGRIASWLEPDGLLFVHIFAHARFAYPFEVKDASDWMAQYFFSGGIMPSDDLLSYFDRDMHIVEHWRLNGMHYRKTAEAWLANMDSNRESILELFAATYGPEHARQWLSRWRIFFMACAELWGYRGGDEWIVSHYLFDRSGPRLGLNVSPAD